MEMRVDNLQMDMTGVELSVANAHLQVQCLEDDVLRPYMDDRYRAEENHWIFEEDLRSRVDRLELERDRVDANCSTTREVLSSWMTSFEALEKSIADEASRVYAMEDHLALGT